MEIERIGDYNFYHGIRRQLLLCIRYKITEYRSLLGGLYFEAEALAKKGSREIIFVEAEEARPECRGDCRPSFVEKIENYFIIGVKNTEILREFHIAHELLHILEWDNFNNPLDTEGDMKLQKYYDEMCNVLVDIHINELMLERGFDLNEYVRWILDYSIRDIINLNADDWEALTIYILHYYNYEQIHDNPFLEKPLQTEYAGLRLEYGLKFPVVTLAIHVMNIIKARGLTPRENFERCMYEIFSDQTFCQSFQPPLPPPKLE